MAEAFFTARADIDVAHIALSIAEVNATAALTVWDEIHAAATRLAEGPQSATDMRVFATRRSTSTSFAAGTSSTKVAPIHWSFGGSLRRGETSSPSGCRVSFRASARRHPPSCYHLPMAAQRFRILFNKGIRVRYISHLDVLRYWERCIRRAELPLAYSQGFTPHPKIAFAGPLALGFTAEAEVLDVTLDERVPLEEFRARLAVETTADLGAIAIEEIPLSTPAPQAAVLWADYAIDLPVVQPGEAAETIQRFLALVSLEWTEERKEKARTFDLRAGVTTLRAEPLDGGTRLRARMAASQQLTVRPEALVAALFPGVESPLICRTGLVFEESSPAHEAWRRRGRFEG